MRTLGLGLGVELPRICEHAGALIPSNSIQSFPWKNLANGVVAELEDSLQSRGDEEGMDNFSQWAEWELVGDLVLHGDRAVTGIGKVMLVVPDAVGADALLIDKIVWLMHLGDLREPCERDAKQRPDPVLDHQTWMHP